MNTKGTAPPAGRLDDAQLRRLAFQMTGELPEDPERALLVLDRLKNMTSQFVTDGATREAARIAALLPAHIDEADKVLAYMVEAISFITTGKSPKSTARLYSIGKSLDDG